MFTGLERVFEMSGPLADLCLLAAVLAKRRWRAFPAFTLLVASNLVLTVGSDWAYASLNRDLFRHIYVASEVLSFVLQLTVLVEIIRAVFQPVGDWARGARRSFVLTTVAGSLAAFGASLLLHPPSMPPALLLQLRSDVFTGLLTCEAVIAVMLVANEVGLPWRSHVMAIGQGLMFWALLTVAIEGGNAYVDPGGSSAIAYYMRSLIYLATVSYWTVTLWREEPARKPISPAMRKYIVALHDKVQYDLGKAGH